jgi:predicted lipoprotein
MRVVLALLLALLALPAPGQEIDHAALARRALDAHIRPGFARLAREAQALEAATRAACKTPGPIDLGTVRAAYDATLDAWARIGHVRFGPGEENGTVFAIEFWPDTKGSTPRALAALLAEENPAADDPAAFAGQSVAARGLMAIDQLLFDPAAAPLDGGTYPCRLLVAITTDLAATADRLVARWDDPWGTILTTAGAPDNPVYLDPAEATKALYSALTEGLQANIDLRLGRPLGTWDRPQPRRAEAWRSGRSLPNLVASTEGLRAFAETVFLPAIGPDESRPVLAAFDAALAAAARVTAPMDVEVATPQGRIHVEALQVALRHVQEEVASHVGPTLGVASGFNSMDGD